VKWSAEARDALREVTDGVPAASRQGAGREVCALAQDSGHHLSARAAMIEETVGREKLGAGWDTLLAKTKFEPAEVVAAAPAGDGARFAWTETPTARLDRVPAGFMRDMTREEVERVARPRVSLRSTLRFVKRGIGHARETMNEVIAGYVSNKKTAIRRGGGGGECRPGIRRCYGVRPVLVLHVAATLTTRIPAGTPAPTPARPWIPTAT